MVQHLDLQLAELAQSELVVMRELTAKRRPNRHCAHRFCTGEDNSSDCRLVRIYSESGSTDSLRVSHSIVLFHGIEYLGLPPPGCVRKMLNSLYICGRGSGDTSTSI